MKVYVGDRYGLHFVRVQDDGGPPRPLPVVPYPYERAGGAASIAWWEGHDAAIRLAASILADLTEGAVDPYTREVLVTPAGVSQLGIAAEPVPTYLARAFAEDVVRRFAAASFTLTEAEARAWLARKGVAT